MLILRIHASAQKKVSNGPNDIGDCQYMQKRRKFRVILVLDYNNLHNLFSFDFKFFKAWSLGAVESIGKSLCGVSYVWQSNQKMFVL